MCGAPGANPAIDNDADSQTFEIRNGRASRGSKSRTSSCCTGGTLLMLNHQTPLMSNARPSAEKEPSKLQPQKPKIGGGVSPEIFTQVLKSPEYESSYAVLSLGDGQLRICR
jgi:hypothetical protein